MDSKEYESLLKSSKLVIFDLDGTLWNLDVDWRSLKERVFSIFVDMGEEPPSSLREAHLRAGGDPDLKNRILKIQSSIEGASLERSDPVAEGHALLNWRRKRGMDNALFTSNTIKTVENLVDPGSFKEVVTIDSVAMPKPAPEGLNRIMDRCGVDSDQTVLLGNSTYDSGAADAAGIRFIDVSNVDMGWFR